MSTHAWHIIALSSGITCLGSCIIWTDVVWNKISSHKFSILNNRGFLVASLGASGGVLITTAMNGLLHDSLKYFRKSNYLNDSKSQHQALLAAVLTGVVICTCLNALIHALTSKSVVHCAHDEADPEAGHSHSHGAGNADDSSTSHSHSHSHNNFQPLDSPNEGTPLKTSIQQYFSTQSIHHAPVTAQTVLGRTHHLLRQDGAVGECHGYELLDDCAVHLQFTEGDDDTHEQVPLHGPPHHHHVPTRYTELLSIGLQTALAITVHKIPEGFLLYATNKEDKDVGFHVFFALAVHNFFEGFTIACPLYLALESRTQAVLSAAILGGGSQPLGALLASLFFKSSKLDQKQFLQFGFIVGATAGFMIIISLQMICTAVEYGGSQRKVVSWAVMGIIIVLVTYAV